MLETDTEGCQLFELADVQGVPLTLEKMEGPAVKWTQTTPAPYKMPVRKLDEFCECLYEAGLLHMW